MTKIKNFTFSLPIIIVLQLLFSIVYAGSIHSNCTSADGTPGFRFYNDNPDNTEWSNLAISYTTVNGGTYNNSQFGPNTGGIYPIAACLPLPKNNTVTVCARHGNTSKNCLNKSADVENAQYLTCSDDSIPALWVHCGWSTTDPFPY